MIESWHELNYKSITLLKYTKNIHNEVTDWLWGYAIIP